jgi:GNAT superfamily N-acetyltransferase
MAVRDDALLDAIQTSFFLYPEIPGESEDLGIPGVQGRVTKISHPLANLVGAATLAPDDADAAIAQVSDIFIGRNLAFGWVTGPSTTPADLPERLMRRGLVKIDEMAGMALTDLSTPISPNPAVEVRETEPDDFEAASDVMARAYGMPEDVASLFARLMGMDTGIRIRGYLAYVDEGREPVAFSVQVYIPGQPVTLLGGAATLPEQRGKGVYTSLVARRLADARQDGIEAAVIQAVRSTSAPICARLGFRELCGLELYAWLPEGEATEHS